MSCLACLKESPALLLEGALGERLKREYHLSFDPQIAMARLVEREEGRQSLETLWREDRESARRHRLPFLATTPTRRANRERVARAGCGDRLFWENLEFLRQVRQAGEGEMYVGGLMGCRGDAYTGQGALAQREARVFHSWAAQRFAQAGADFLMAGIMPTLPEAAGMAQAMGETGLPYLISFTLRGDGCLIDGTPLSQAIAYIDQISDYTPAGYMANCLHPLILEEALGQPCNRVPLVRERFWGLQANTACLPYDQLDRLEEAPEGTPPEVLAEQMLRLRERFGLRLFGGCCGTTGAHLEAIARRLEQAVRQEGENV